MINYGTTNYIDPGSGTVIATTIWASLAGIIAIVVAFFAGFFRRIKDAIAKLFRKDEIK